MFRGLKSLLTGIIAGTAIGVMFAPDKGSKTRKKVKTEVKDGGSGVSSIKEALNEMGADIKDAYDNVNENEKVKAMKSKVKSHAKRAKNKGEEWYSENIPAEQRKKVRRAIKKTKKTANKAVKKAKSTAKEAAKKASKKKS